MTSHAERSAAVRKQCAVLPVADAETTARAVQSRIDGNRCLILLGPPAGGKSRIVKRALLAAGNRPLLVLDPHDEHGDALAGRRMLDVDATSTVSALSAWRRARAGMIAGVRVSDRGRRDGELDAWFMEAVEAFVNEDPVIVVDELGALSASARHRLGSLTGRLMANRKAAVVLASQLMRKVPGEEADVAAVLRNLTCLPQTPIDILVAANWGRSDDDFSRQVVEESLRSLHPVLAAAYRSADQNPQVLLSPRWGFWSGTTLDGQRKREEFPQEDTYLCNAKRAAV